MSYGHWGYFKAKPRKEVKGGIKAQSKRGDFGATWWAKRWIAVLESFDIGARLSRGRSYARSGQVLSIDISKSAVTAKVQGSSARPYIITIKVTAIPDKDWQKLATALSAQAIFAAKLLAGEMPQEIEQAFTEAGLSLFPAKLRDLVTDCSCPDWSNPCKHIAAVYYLLGEEFDRDPFLLFKLRGMEREPFIKLLGAATPTTRQAETVVPDLPPEPLPAEAARFWSACELPADFYGEVRTPPVNAALLKRLGKFPFWRGAEDLSASLELVYSLSSATGVAVFIGEEHAAESGKNIVPG